MLQPEEGQSYWQPTWANGYSIVKLSPKHAGPDNLTMGIQVIAPGGYVREHSHTPNQEILFCFAGKGTVWREMDSNFRFRVRCRRGLRRKSTASAAYRRRLSGAAGSARDKGFALRLRAEGHRRQTFSVMASTRWWKVRLS